MEFCLQRCAIYLRTRVGEFGIWLLIVSRRFVPAFESVKEEKLLTCLHVDCEGRGRGGLNPRFSPCVCQVAQGYRSRSSNCNCRPNSRYARIIGVALPLLTDLGFCTLLDRETLLNEIMTSVEDLVSDTSQHVRAALGTQISGLAPILGKDELVMLRHSLKYVR